MKGPQERLKYDLRRLWECPTCKRRERVAASQTFRFCNCQLKQTDSRPVVMKLIQDGIQRLAPVIAIKHEQPSSVSEQMDAHVTMTETNPDHPPVASDVAVASAIVADDSAP